MKFRRMAAAVAEPVLRGLGISPRSVRDRVAHWRGRDICRNVNGTSYGRSALLVYITHPFFSQAGVNGHQNQWQAVAMARVMGWFHYDVDVIDYNRSTPRLTKGYDLVIDLAPGWHGSRVYQGHLNPGCKRIFYVTGSYPKWAAQESEKRREAVRQRRGVWFGNHREFRPLPAEVEHFDGAFMIGNAHNWATYTRERRMPPVYFIANTGYAYPYPLDAGRRSAKKFLFFASGDQIHKGLDLLLEVFAQPGFPCELYICSAFRREKRFCAAYRRELFGTANIHAVGFVDIMGDTFRELAETCAYLIVPSCSEGQMGSALTAMSAGIIPILSKACGYDEDEAVLLPDCTLSTIERYVRTYAQKDAAWLRCASERVLRLVRERYRPERYVRSIQAGLEGVLGVQAEPSEADVRAALGRAHGGGA